MSKPAYDSHDDNTDNDDNDDIDEEDDEEDEGYDEDDFENDEPEEVDEDVVVVEMRDATNVTKTAQVGGSQPPVYTAISARGGPKGAAYLDNGQLSLVSTRS